jgi:5-methylthioadenosine/S-adenosylhomocysteine deaminase
VKALASEYVTLNKHIPAFFSKDFRSLEFTEITAIKAHAVITSFEENGIIPNGVIIVEGDRIKWIGPESKAPKFKIDIKIDASDKIAAPGLIDAHAHLFQTFGRTLGANRSLDSWVKDVEHPMARKMTPEDMWVAAQLGCIEMIHSGITTVVDNREVHTSYEDIESEIDAISKVGLRCILARGIRERTPRADALDIEKWLMPYSIKEEIAITERLIKERNSSRDMMVRVWPSPTAFNNISREGLLKVRDLADKYGTGIHMHIGETRDSQTDCIKDFGCREVEILGELRLLKPMMNIVHGVWLNRREMKLIAESAASVIHNPVSNCYLASGVADLCSMFRLGINVALGTDGVLSSDTCDMFENIRTAILLQKATTLNPTVMSSRDALHMATVNGAKAMGIQESLGTLAPEKRADLILVDLKKPHLTPSFDMLSLLAYSVKSSDVDTVLINGKPVLQNKCLTTVDENEVIERACSRAGRFKDEFKALQT